MTEPCDLSAIEARRLIGRKSLSPVELTESCISRIEDIDGSVNAMVTRCFERAVLEAKIAEKAVMDGKRLGVLHGLPMGVKDLNVMVKYMKLSGWLQMATILGLGFETWQFSYSCLSTL